VGRGVGGGGAVLRCEWRDAGGMTDLLVQQDQCTAVHSVIHTGAQPMGWVRDQVQFGWVSGPTATSCHAGQSSIHPPPPPLLLTVYNMQNTSPLTDIGATATLKV
jgi:hypothetical protein